MENLRQVRPVTRIRVDILSQIRGGQLRPGDAGLPIDELSRRYEVARETARRVVLRLVKEGYLSSRRGRGTSCESDLEDAARRRCSSCLDHSILKVCPK